MFKFITVTLIFAKSTSKSKVNYKNNSNNNNNNANNASISHSTRSISRICLCACRKFLQKRPQATQTSTPQSCQHGAGAAKLMYPRCLSLSLSLSLYSMYVCACVVQRALYVLSNTDTAQRQRQLQKVCDSKQKFS